MIVELAMNGYADGLVNLFFLNVGMNMFMQCTCLWNVHVYRMYMFMECLPSVSILISMNLI